MNAGRNASTTQRRSNLRWRINERSDRLGTAMQHSELRWFQNLTGSALQRSTASRNVFQSGAWSACRHNVLSDRFRVTKGIRHEHTVIRLLAHRAIIGRSSRGTDRRPAIQTPHSAFFPRLDIIDVAIAPCSLMPWSILARSYRAGAADCAAFRQTVAYLSSPHDLDRSCMPWYCNAIALHIVNTLCAVAVSRQAQHRQLSAVARLL